MIRPDGARNRAGCHTAGGNGEVEADGGYFIPQAKNTTRFRKSCGSAATASNASSSIARPIAIL